MALILRHRRDLHDLRTLGDVCDIQTQLIDADIVEPPHDLLPQWFVQVLIYCSLLIALLTWIFPVPPLWWLP